MIVAIDFSRSNKDPSDPASLHNEKDNAYTEAIRAVGDVLKYYDYDNQFPVYGFGAKLPPNYSIVSQCFSVNKDYFDPEVDGIDGIIESNNPL